MTPYVFGKLESVPKKRDWQKKMLITKNPQFYSKWLEIQALLPIQFDKDS